MAEELFSNVEDGITPNIPTDEVENDHMFLLAVVDDDSDSMDSFAGAKAKAKREFIDSIVGSKSDDEIMVSLTTFASRGDTKYHGFDFASNMPTDEHVNSGLTALYDAIIRSQEGLFSGDGQGYMEQLNASGVRTRGALVIFSDGQDNDSYASGSNARAAIELLRKQEILVAFVAFGDPAKGIADKIGVDQKNVLETAATASDLRQIWGIMSKSAVSASKNAATGPSQDAFFTV